MTDYPAKLATLEARLVALDADAARIAEKRAVTEAQLARLRAKMSA